MTNDTRHDRTVARLKAALAATESQLQAAKREIASHVATLPTPIEQTPTTSTTTPTDTETST